MGFENSLPMCHISKPDLILTLFTSVHFTEMTQLQVLQAAVSASMCTIPPDFMSLQWWFLN